MIRLLLVIFIAVPVTAWYAWEVIWAVLRKAPNLSCVCYQAPRKWSRLMLWVAGVKVVVENLGVISEETSQIIVANHVSWYDVFALAANVPGEYLFVAKKEVKRFPILAQAITACGHIYIDRRDHQSALDSLEAIRKRLAQTNPTVIMFPEGTRSATGELQRFKKGAFVLALQAQADIVPVAISGSGDIMNKSSMRIYPGTITVRFGEPIPVDLLTMEDRDQLIRDTREVLLDLLAVDPESN